MNPPEIGSYWLWHGWMRVVVTDYCRMDGQLMVGNKCVDQSILDSATDRSNSGMHTWTSLNEWRDLCKPDECEVPL